MSKYNYYNVKELSAKREVNFYGVILDATFPCKEENDEKLYVSTIKVIDHSVNVLNDPLEYSNDIVYITVKSDLIEYLPFVQHIGDIIRIHRGNYTHKTKRNVYLNLDSKGCFKSSWCIFPGASDLSNKSFDPIACSHRTFTFEDVDTHYLSALRNWLRKYISQKGSLVYPKTVKLIDRNRELNYEKDLLVHVVHKMKNSSDSISLWVQDDTDACEMVVYNIYNYIQPGDIVRVRSFKTYQKNIIVLNSFSNILSVPKTSQLYEAFALALLNRMKTLDSSVTLPSKQSTNIDTSEISKRKSAISFVDDKSSIPYRKISDIRFDDSRFWMELNIISQTSNSSLVNFFEENTGKSYEDQKKSGKSLTPYFNTQFIATDDEYGSATVKLFLSTHDGQGDGFLGTASDYVKSDKKAKDILKKITDQKHSVQVLVESVQVGTGDGDKIFRIVGSYEAGK